MDVKAFVVQLKLRQHEEEDVRRADSYKRDTYECARKSILYEHMDTHERKS